MKPRYHMRGYEVYPLVSDFVRELSPDDLGVWQNRVAQFAGSKTLTAGRLNASFGDGVLWVPKELSEEEMAEILTLAEEAVRGWQEKFRPRVRVLEGEERRSLP